MEKQKTYPLYINKEEEITYKKKLSRNTALFSLLISGLGILAWPLLLLGGLGVLISLMAWIYYSNVEYKESIKPVLYEKAKKMEEESWDESSSSAVDEYWWYYDRFPTDD